MGPAEVAEGIRGLLRLLRPAEDAGPAEDSGAC